MSLRLAAGRKKRKIDKVETENILGPFTRFVNSGKESMNMPCRLTLRSYAGWMLLMMTGALCSCATVTPERRPYLINESMDRADQHKAQGELPEAAELYSVVLLSDPTNQIAANKLKELGRQGWAVAAPSRLGVNRAWGRETRSLGLAIGLYPFNRILDVADIVSLHVGLEGGLLADVHATRALGAGLGGGGGMQLGWWQKRNFGVGVGHLSEFAVGPMAFADEGFARTGTAGMLASSYSLAGVNHPYSRAFQRHYDYYGVGGRVIALFVGAGVEFHPLEVLDAAWGFLLIDFLHDDIGQTRALKLSIDDRAAMEGLLNTVEPSELQKNLETLQALAEAPAEPVAVDASSGAPAPVAEPNAQAPAAAVSNPIRPIPAPVARPARPVQPAQPVQPVIAPTPDPVGGAPAPVRAAAPAAAAAPRTRAAAPAKAERAGSLTGTVTEDIPAVPAVPLAR